MCFVFAAGSYPLPADTEFVSFRLFVRARGLKITTFCRDFVYYLLFIYTSISVLYHLNPTKTVLVLTIVYLLWTSPRFLWLLEGVLWLGFCYLFKPINRGDRQNLNNVVNVLVSH
ncbi:hypothetical protein F4679DRAFT_314913 [Xylaria curta]|nr:hypothetical protein F4679DRAFT_314913 [Xylaria curta]